MKNNEIVAALRTTESRSKRELLDAAADLIDMHDYLHAQKGYGWHISDLRIYDAPRELSGFTGLRNTRFGAAPYDIKRAPQSWCYVEAMKDECPKILPVLRRQRRYAEKWALLSGMLLK